MKAKILALNLLLLAGIALIAWQARVRWMEARTRRNTVLNVAAKPAPPPPLVPAAKPDAPQAAKYAEVAQKNLFSKDRNPNVIIDPPKVEQPKPMPALPVVYGVLGLPSGTRAIMAVKAGDDSRPVREGDKVGEFKIVALDPQNVTFDWEGKQVSRKIDDLIDRSSHGQTGPASQNTSGQVVASAVPLPGQQGPQPQQQPSNNQPAPQSNSNVLGVEMGSPGQSIRACRPGESSPAGTVLEGYKKVLIPTPMGDQCKWVPNQ